LSTLRTLLACAAIVGVGAVLVAWIFGTEPEAQREGARKRTAMLVELRTLEAGTFRPMVTAVGTVRPARQITLRAQVSGEVTAVGGGFTPGGLVTRGERLLVIDPADLAAAHRQRLAELTEAQSALRIEGGRRNVAQRELAVHGERAAVDEALILRQPQLASAQAQVAFAEAAVEQAARALGRARVTAPFDAQVLSRAVNRGSVVTSGAELAQIVGTKTYWVEVALPQADLQWLSFPGEAGAEGAAVTLTNPSAWPEGASRQGRLLRSLGALDERTRLVRVLVEVDDPLVRSKQTVGPPLLIGAFVRARMEARPFEDVVRVARAWLRRRDTLWIMKDGKLDVRTVKVAYRDAEYAYVAEGVGPGERVVISDLSIVAPGAALRESGAK